MNKHTKTTEETNTVRALKDLRENNDGLIYTGFKSHGTNGRRWLFEVNDEMMERIAQMFADDAAMAWDPSSFADATKAVALVKEVTDSDAMKAFAELTVSALRKMAGANKIKGTAKLNKPKLIKVLLDEGVTV